MLGRVRGLLRLWDTATCQELLAKQDAKTEAEAVVSVIPLPQKSLILAALADYTLAFYRVLRNHPQKRALLEPIRRISGTHDEILDPRPTFSQTSPPWRSQQTRKILG